MTIKENTASIKGLIRMLKKYEEDGVIDLVVKHNAGGVDRPITEFSIEQRPGENPKLVVKDY